jgi:hypothetical protein
MALPLILALVTAQEPGQQQPPQEPVEAAPAVQAAPVAPTFQVAQAVVEPNRIAVTPRIDGKIEEEEWDSLTSGPQTTGYFQWEPGRLHAAAKVPVGADLILSFDFGANGWLIGRDNLEVRIGIRDGKPVLTARTLDATNVAGPVWQDLPGLAVSSLVAATEDATGTTYEVTLADPGLGILPTAEGSKLAVRFDASAAAMPPVEPFIPRILAPVQLTFKRAAGLPTGLRFEPEGEARTVVPGQSTRIRLTFRGSNELKLQKLQLRSEGFAKDDTNLLETPFPPFDNKGRAFIDYDTTVATTAKEGYRLLRGTLASGDGIASVLQTSYRIAPPVHVDLVRETFRVSDRDRSVRQGFYIRSNSARPVGGKLTLILPEPIRVLNGNERRFVVSNARGRLRMAVDLFVPAGLSGTFPVTFQTEVGGTKHEEKGFITFQP